MSIPSSSQSPLGYTGIDLYDQPRFINANRPPQTTDIEIPGTRWMYNSDSPAVIYETLGNGVWQTGGNAHATTSDFGIVILNDSVTMAGATDEQVPTALAIKTYADNLAIAGSPVATTSTSGIGRLVTDANAVARIASTGSQAYFVQPSNLTAIMSSPGPIGDTTPSTIDCTDLVADGLLDLDTTVAGHIKVTGAADFTIESTLGSVVINAEEAVDDAIQLTSAAGGLAASLGLSVVIASAETNADSVQLTSAGGMDLTATGAAGKDIDIVCTSGSINLNAGENIATSMVLTNKGMDINITGAAGQDFDLTNTGGSVNVTATENDSGCIYIRANGGASERIRLHADQGTGVDSVLLESDVGGITLSSGLASADAINLAASAGGVDIDGALQVNIASSQNAASAIVIAASAGGIDITATGAVAEDLDLTCTNGSVNIVAGEADAAAMSMQAAAGGLDVDCALQMNLTCSQAAADAIRVNASDAAGGIDVDCGTGGIAIDSTGAISLDGAAASNFAVSGAGIDLTLDSAAGQLILTGGEAAANAVRIQADDAAGGIDIDCGTGGTTLDSTGAISLDAAAASNFTVTGATADLTLASVGGSVNVTASEAAANALRLQASDAAGGLDLDTGTGGVIVDTTGAISLDSAAASNFTVTGAFDLTLNSSAGSVVITGAEAAADAVSITASDAAGGVTIAAGSAGVAVTGDTVVTGDLTTSGNMILSSVASYIQMNGGAVTDFIGSATLVGGTVTVANTNIAATDRILITRNALNASPALGNLIYTISAGASFTVTSYNDSGAALVTDVSSFSFVIIRQN